MDTVLRPLLKEGVLRMTMPDKPNDVRQRYLAAERLDHTEFEL